MENSEIVTSVWRLWLCSTLTLQVTSCLTALVSGSYELFAGQRLIPSGVAIFVLPGPDQQDTKLR